jgi:hypothetical protein
MFGDGNAVGWSSTSGSTVASATPAQAGGM